MSTSAVSSASIFQELQSFYQTRQGDLKQLGSALQSGDLAGAQQAFQSLAVLGEGGPFANSEPFGKTSRANAFNAIGEALQAGNLSQAQAAFSALTGVQGNSAISATPAAVVNLSSTHNIEPPTQNASSIYQQLQAYRQQRQADIAQLGQDLQGGNLAAAQQDFTALTALGQSGPNKNGQPFQQADRAQAFQAIGQALQSGDLAGAQSAFTSLQSTFGKQSQPAQAAISAYNSGVAEIVINFAPPAGTTPPNGTPAALVPPLEPPVSQPPASLPVNTSAGADRAPELVINLGGASGSSSTTGSGTPELVINLGQGNGSSSNSPEQVQITLGSGNSGATVSIDATQGQNNSEQVTINLQQRQNYELILNLFGASSASQTQASSSNALSVSA